MFRSIFVVVVVVPSSATSCRIADLINWQGRSRIASQERMIFRLVLPFYRRLQSPLSAESGASRLVLAFYERLQSLQSMTEDSRLVLALCERLQSPGDRRPLVSVSASFLCATAVSPGFRRTTVLCSCERAQSPMLSIPVLSYLRASLDVHNGMVCRRTICLCGTVQPPGNCDKSLCLRG